MFVLQSINVLAGQSSQAQSCRRPQRTQRINDDEHVDDFLNHGAGERRQETEGGHRHGQQRQPHAGQHALQGDVAGTAGNLQCLDQTVQAIHQQHNTRRFRRGSGTTGPHGHADGGRRQCGRVVDAVADHQRARARTALLYGTHLILRAQPGTQLVDAGRQRNHFGCFQAIAREHDNSLDTAVAQPAKGLWGFPTQAVRENQQAGKVPIHFNEASTAGRIIHLAQHRGGPIADRGLGMSKRQRAETHSPPLNQPTKTGARAFFNLLRGAERQSELARCVDDGLGDGVHRGLCQRSGQAQQVLWIDLAIDLDRLQAGVTTGQGARLVEKQLFGPCQRFQSGAVLDEDAAPRRPGDTGHDGDRHRQDQRTGRGHHQHRQSP